MNILIVDDDSTNRRLLRATLEAEGHRVLDAADGVEALGVLERERVEGVISDILMSGMDGYRLCSEVRRNPRFNLLPFVFYTSTFDSPGDERFAREVGADDYLKKPCPTRALLEALERAASSRTEARPIVPQKREELLLVKEYNELLVKKLEEKHRNLQLQTEVLRKSEERNRLLAAIVESSDDAIIGKSLDGTVLSWNDGAVKLYGYTSREVVGKPITVIIPPDRVEEWRDLQTRAKRGEYVAGIETVRVRKDGRLVDIAFKISPVKDERGNIVGLSAYASDIAERKRWERELKDSQEQLRALAAHLQAVREEERTRISREIHDELGQILTSLKMDLRWIERKRTATASADVANEITLKIVEAQKLIDDTIQTVQRIAADLRPSVLDNLGLPAAIRYEVKRFEERTGIHSTLELQEEMPAADRNTATNLFRIFQEILTNVARHAGASAIAVQLREEHGGLALEVRDDGRGISADASSRPASLGLLGMTERVKSLDGTLCIEGAPGRGTKVTVRVPRKLDGPRTV